MRKFFYSRWTVLELMQPGVWYYGFELADKGNLFRGSIHIKLAQLIEDGYVKRRLGPDGFRSQYRRTDKHRPGKRKLHWGWDFRPQPTLG